VQKILPVYVGKVFTVKAPFTATLVMSALIQHSPSLRSLLCPWIRRFTMINNTDFLCLVTSNKQQFNWEEVKEPTGILGNW